jgi:hypothetical protein
MPISKLPRAGMQHRRQVAVPCREAALLCLRTLSSAATIAARLPHLCASACEALFAQVSASFFVPFCLSAAAVAARVRVLGSALLLKQLESFTDLVTIAAMLPRGPKAAAAWADAHGVPEMARVTWAHGLPQVHFVAFQAGEAGFEQLAAALAERHAIMQHAGVAVKERGGLSSIPSFSA